MRSCPHFLVSRRGRLTAALLAILAAAPSLVTAEDPAPAPVLEDVARDVLVPPPALAGGDAVSLPVGTIGGGADLQPPDDIAAPIAIVPPRIPATQRRGIVSLRDIYDEDLDFTAALEEPAEGLFSARLPTFLAPDSVLTTPRRVRTETSPSGYSLGGNLRASLDYTHARAFPMAPSQMVRKQGYLDLSTGKDRDVLGLMMAWSWRNSTLDLGYRLESSRFQHYGEGRTLSSLMAGDGVDHAVTIGITRRWGADDQSR